MQYDDFARAYAEHTAGSLSNALYDRPAILDLVGEVSGKDVLDIGCAAGHLTSELAARGARVVGIDGSAVLIELARERLGDRATFHCADLLEPLDFLADGSFDVVTASLVMHYLEDWGPTLGELGRVLRPDGALVMSVHHPEDWHWYQRPNYFATELIVDEWNIAGRPTQVRFFRRPLGAMFSALRDARFCVDRLVEPMPLPESEKSHPGEYGLMTREPTFLYFRALK